LKVSILFRLSLDFVFNLEFLMVEHAILESASVWCTSRREEWYIPWLQVEFEAGRDDWSSSDWIRTKEPSVSCGTGVLHRLAYEEDATENLFRDNMQASSHLCCRDIIGQCKSTSTIILGIQDDSIPA
jgi:hypothetical protein